MGRIFGIVIIVVAIWVALTVYTEGVQHAFGGAFAFFDQSSDQDAPRDTRTVPRRAGDAVQSAHDAAAARRNRMLSE